MLLFEPYMGIIYAAALGSLIGLERELHGQPAGLRTHMILSVGAALAAILSISYSQFLRL
jgi:putative Mg2+ transporter-C (MgtC) family protein